MEIEFDTVARWTTDAVAELGPDHAIPAACRGSASPAGLDRLCRDLRPGMRLGDVGGGTGGPAAYAREQAGVVPVVVDPMPGACRAAARMFGMDAVVGGGERVPLATGSLDACWCLGVLCTLDDNDKARLVRELRRVLAPGGPLGLLVFTADEPRPAGAPDGNRFPTLGRVRELLTDHGFVVDDEVAPDDLPPAPPSWRERADRVDDLLARRHGDDPRFAEAEEQSGRLGALMSDGVVRGHLLRAR
ncbi:methyltransferase family protein [Pseudonocardia endophytica]|uniref:Methyltransferase family protein n=2 Tax=Pseudonocardia endophytica TaxID=401976 RepID=A0A4R1HRE6_PSEEN|nr:methyltransferase family protein [Pseudonocardia endophytica]